MIQLSVPVAVIMTAQGVRRVVGHQTVVTVATMCVAVVRQHLPVLPIVVRAPLLHVRPIVSVVTHQQNGLVT